MLTPIDDAPTVAGTTPQADKQIAATAQNSNTVVYTVPEGFSNSRPPFSFESQNKMVSMSHPKVTGSAPAAHVAASLSKARRRRRFGPCSR